MSPGTKYYFLLESLENRALLAGVTLVTHGYQPVDSNAAPWVQTMATSIAAIAGPQTPIYKLKIILDINGDPYVSGFSFLQGSPPSDAANKSGEVVLILDWADASGLGFLSSYVPTDKIARMVAPYLLSTFPTIGIDHPLAELPLHLIGHSRGGSVVAELASDLAEDGIWVDQLTTLDPHPVSFFADDPEIALSSNIFFADNYYQTEACISSGLIYGESIAGAVNYDLTSNHQCHSGVHDYYQNSINSAGSGKGFDFSLLRGHQRHSYGISKYFGDAGGSGERSAVSRAGAQWPNIGSLTIRDTDGIVTRGQTVPVHLFFQDADSAVTISFFLDTNRNPYDSAYGIGSQTWQSTGDSILYWDTLANATTQAPLGRFNLLAQITDASGHTRYAYADRTVTIRDSIPIMTSLSARPKAVIKPATFVLTANGVTGILAIQQVAFFRDSNGNGRYDEADALLGRDFSAVGGWRFTVKTRRLRSGVNRFFAFAFDGNAWSNPRAASVRIRP